MRSRLSFMAFLAALAVATYSVRAYQGFTTSPSRLKGCLAPEGNLKGFVANGEWFYTWPHGEIPFTIANWSMTSHWTDESVQHGGRTAQNWGKPIVFESESSKVSIWAERDHHRTIINPVDVEDWGIWSTVGFQSIPFHGLPAAIAVVREANDVQTMRLFLALRIDDRLFRIEVEGKDGTDSWDAAIACAEAIRSFKGIGPEDIFRKKISEHQTLVVTRSSIARIDPPATTRATKPADEGPQPIGLFSISATVTEGDGSSRVIEGPRFFVYSQDEPSQFEVLDATVCSDGRTVLVIAGSWSSMSILDLPAHGEPKIIILPGADWSLLAAARPSRPGRLSAKLSMIESGEKVGCLKVVVTDRIQDMEQTTTFVQKNEGSDVFKRVARENKGSR